MRGALRGQLVGMGSAGMGDWWSDLLFNLNPSNSSIHNQYVTPIANSIYGIPLGSISNATQQGMQDLLTGNFNLSDIGTMMQNGGMTPSPKAAPAAAIVSTLPQGPTVTPTAAVPWGKIAIGGVVVLAVGGGIAYAVHKKKKMAHA